MNDLHRPLPHPIIPTLAELRLAVLDLNRKRRPKWRFRLAPDLVVQLQPVDRPTSRVAPSGWDGYQALAQADDPSERRDLWDAVFSSVQDVFDGVAIIGPTDVTSLDSFPKTSTPTVRVVFTIFDLGAGAWVLVVGHGSWSRGRADLVSAAVDRLRGALSPEAFAAFTPDMMLTPSCLACGKRLTDPASMARWIGPECSGTTSLRVPWLFSAGEGSAA